MLTTPSPIIDDCCDVLRAPWIGKENEKQRVFPLVERIKQVGTGARIASTSSAGRAIRCSNQHGKVFLRVSNTERTDAAMAEHILLVEDESAIADTLIYALQAEGFQVSWCCLATDAMRALDDHGADLLILDIGLPDMNGFEVCRQVQLRWQVPVIFLTARKEEVDRIAGLELGADDYVTKPFSPREVAARARAVLRRSQRVVVGAIGPSDTGDVALFMLDDDRKRIAYKGQWLDLTRYEYLILHRLASRPGQVFSREQLMEQVWDDPCASYDRAVDTHIKTLRAKLKEIHPQDMPIRTHRGLGYSVTPA